MEDIELQAVYGLAFKLGVLPSDVMQMGETDFANAIAFLNIQAKREREHRS